MDTPLKTARKERGWSQHRLLVSLEAAGHARGLPMPTRASLKTQISRWENGHVKPQQPYTSMLSEVLERAPTDLGIVDGGLWLPTSGAASTTPEYLASMQDLLGDYARADNSIGPGQLVAAVVQHLRQFDAAVLGTRGVLREDVLRLSSRFAEFAGWLCQDAGDLDSAQQWTDRAHDFLEEVGDVRERAYVLMRKSAIAADRGELARSVSLSNAVIGDLSGLPGRLGALVMRQAAISQALTRDPRAAQRSVGRSLELAASADQRDRYAYCTEPYLRMEAGVVDYYLRKYDLAAEQLGRAANSWPDGYARDRGLCLARLALVESVRGNVDAACEIGTRAVDVAATTGSARVRSVIRTLRRRLAPESGHTVVSEFVSYSQLVK